jgi:prevent-host-death family protein
MKTVSIHEAKSHLSSLIAAVERSGEKIIIQRHGRAVAEINPISHKSRLIIDPTLKKVQILCDLTQPTVEEWNEI